ncbi:amidohydrolase family protein [Paenibacillus sp. YYML68]|uniref:amidohydrolase family protein n=1 Tax=Paenibacillus sp. YYML68 TaxID=2909250 RepID=UPI00248F8829|nr:amidohydrolase family protein [Paenibacillus sp. YYML68]
MNIFDADLHWIEMEHDLIKKAGLLRSRVMPRDGWDRTLGGKFPEKAISQKDLLHFMESNVISKAAIHPTRCLSLGMIQERAIAAQIAESFHQYVLEQMVQLPKDKIFPMALAVPQDIDYTIRKLPQYKEMGFHGILLLPHGHNKVLGDEEFMEFYATCEDLGMTVTIHANSFGAIGTAGYSRFAEVHCLSFPVELIRQFISMTLSGVFEIYPKLHVAFLEAGVGWMPYWINRLDDEFDKRHEELPIESRPSEILKKSKVYVSCSGYEKEIAEVDGLLGGGVLWQSDYPHWDHTNHVSVEVIKNRISEDLFRKVMWDNPLECYLKYTE